MLRGSLHQTIVPSLGRGNGQVQGQKLRSRRCGTSYDTNIMSNRIQGGHSDSHYNRIHEFPRRYGRIRLLPVATNSIYTVIVPPHPRDLQCLRGNHAMFSVVILTTPDISQKLVHCCASVADAGATVGQLWPIPAVHTAKAIHSVSGSFHQHQRLLQTMVSADIWWLLQHYLLAVLSCMWPMRSYECRVSFRSLCNARACVCPPSAHDESLTTGSTRVLPGMPRRLPGIFVSLVLLFSASQPDNCYCCCILWSRYPCPAELYFSSFKTGIANAISSFKWRKIWHLWKINMCENKHLINWSSITNYVMDFSVILFPLKPTRNRIYTAPAAQRLINKSRRARTTTPVSG